MMAKQPALPLTDEPQYGTTFTMAEINAAFAEVNAANALLAAARDSVREFYRSQGFEIDTPEFGWIEELNAARAFRELHALYADAFADATTSKSSRDLFPVNTWRKSAGHARRCAETLLAALATAQQQTSEVA